MEIDGLPYVSRGERIAWKDQRALAKVLVRLARPGEEIWESLAELEAHFTDYDDDVALLRLIKPFPFEKARPAPLGSIHNPFNEPFRSYGYPWDLVGRPQIVDGKISGVVSSPSKMKLREEPLQLSPDTTDIRPGMSGSPVLGIRSGLVVGIIAETNQRNRVVSAKLGWAVAARVLALEPIRLRLANASHEYGPLPYPQADIAAACQATIDDPGVVLLRTDEGMCDWVGRTDLLYKITTDWREQSRRVIVLHGFGGEGKSLLAQRWAGES
jgi:hypothetical protein